MTLSKAHNFLFRQCENMQDPYCQWNEEVQECQGTGNQNLTSCPALNFLGYLPVFDASVINSAHRNLV